MPINLFRGDWDDGLREIEAVFAEYQKSHPNAHIDFYRPLPLSIRIRVVDPTFQGMSLSQRNAYVWKSLKSAPVETQQDVSMLVLLTPDQVEDSIASREFEEPLEIPHFS